MSTNAILIVKPWDWRRIIFTILAGVVTFFLLMNLFRLAAGLGITGILLSLFMVVFSVQRLLARVGASKSPEHT